MVLDHLQGQMAGVGVACGPRRGDLRRRNVRAHVHPRSTDATLLLARLPITARSLTTAAALLAILRSPVPDRVRVLAAHRLAGTIDGRHSVTDRETADALGWKLRKVERVSGELRALREWIELDDLDQK